jgi:hypothetical protein
MELTDHDTFFANTNNQGAFTFDKNGASEVQAGMISGGFVDVMIDYAADSTTPGPESPESPESGDPCGPGADCRHGDGCCPADCVYEVDDDCDPATARELPTGCTAAGAGSPPSLRGFVLYLIVAACWATAIRANRPRRDRRVV